MLDNIVDAMENGNGSVAPMPRQWESRTAASNAPYRGLATDVAGLELDAALDKAGLDWKTVPRPMLIVGRTENRPSQYLSLIRSDTGAELGVCTESYQPHSNRQLLGAFYGVAESLDVRITRAGAVDGGARVFAEAVLPHSFTLPVSQRWQATMARNPLHNWVTEDKTELRMVMSSGHTPGVRTSYRLYAWRLICSNGAAITEDISLARWTHREAFDPNRLEDIRIMLRQAAGQFDSYLTKALVLQAAHTTESMDRAYVVQLLQPQIVDAAITKHDKELGHRNRVEAAIEATEHKYVNEALYTRSTRDVLAALSQQPTAGMTAGTLWGAYNAVTWSVDHLRGRGRDTAVESAMFGEGAKVKSRALDLAVQYAHVLGGREQVQEVVA